MLFTTLVALSLAALLSGCGQNSTPTGVTPLDETTPAAPLAIGKLDDTATPCGWLTWQPSPSANVASYEIYQYSPDPTREDSYVLVGLTDVGTTRYPLPSVASPQTDYYRLRAVSTTGVRSPWSATADITVYPYGGGNDVRDPSGDPPLQRPLINP
jgi:hypothetical protein